MYLTNSQRKIVNELFDEYQKKERKIIDFKAPTGSGKTFMSAHLISKIFSLNLNKKTMIIVATISTAELPKAFANKIDQYKKFLDFKKFDVEFIKSPSNNKIKNLEHVKSINLENNKVLIFGISSFGRKKIFTEQGILQNFIHEAKEREWNIIYIRDEAHRMGKSKSDVKFYERFDKKIIDLSSFTIQMTATPKGENDLIELKVKDLKDDNLYLLKDDPKYNEFQQNTRCSIELIDECLKKFKMVQNEYKKLEKETGFFIRPALLIQVDSKKGDSIEQRKYNEMLEKLILKLENNNLGWLKYFSESKEGNRKEDPTLECASKIDSNYDVIIFKIGPATGWDIPRACMLLQIREVSSETLNIQTIGRIKRNPLPNLEKKEISNKYYIYSNYQEGKRSLAYYKIKNNFEKLILKNGVIKFNKNEEEFILQEYIKKFKKIINNDYNLKLMKDNFRKSKLEINEIEYKSKLTNENEDYLENTFQLKIWIIKKLITYRIFFNDFIKEYTLEFSKNNKLPKEIIYYTLIKSCIGEIKDKYNESIKLNRKNEEFIINNVDILKNYRTWISDDSINVVTNNINVYGYELIESRNDKKNNIQYLDSQPEKIFLKRIIAILKNDKYKSKIQFYSKMPTLYSKINFEYVSSSDFKIHKSYIDFSLKTKNGKILMIEVKSVNDYDGNKTNDLINTFKKYEINYKNEINMLVVWVNTKTNKGDEGKKIYFLDKNNKEDYDIEKVIENFLK